MRCKAVQEQLQEYLDGQLSPGQAQAIQAHLDACAACREELALLRQVDAALATVPLLEESAHFTTRIMAQLGATGTKSPQGRTRQTSPAFLPAFRLRWEDAAVSFAFAGVMMAVLLAFSLLEPQHLLNVEAFLERIWWTWLPELDRLWQAAQAGAGGEELIVWGFSSLCVAAAASASAVALWRQWAARSASQLRQR